MQKKILIVVDAPGPAEFIAPVIPLLKKNANVKLATVKEPPTKILAKYDPIRCDSENEAGPIYKKFNPDVLLVAVSSLTLGPYINNKFTELAHADGKKIVCFQDFWANHRWPMNYKMMKYWQKILVPDDLAENLILQDGYTGKVAVTGSPAFEKFKRVNVAEEKSRLRKKLKIARGAFVILHCGTGTPQSWREDEITFNLVAQTIRNLKKEFPNLVFISRPHPRDEKSNRYQKLAPDLGLLDTSSVKMTEELLPVADVVMAMYSTNLVHACYLRIPAISILLPDAGKKILEGVSLPDFPPNAVGAAIGIYKDSPKILEGEIKKIMSNEKHRLLIRRLQKQFFPFGKKSPAKRVAEEIWK